jgi:hypothetical protein
MSHEKKRQDGAENEGHIPMALMRFAMKVRTTAPQSPSAGKTVQYLVAVQGAKEVQYLDRTSPSTKLRTDLVHDEVVNLPRWAHGDPSIFFRAAAVGEEKQGTNPQVTKHYVGRWAYALEMALPRELPREQQLDMARTFLASHLERKVYYWVMHEPVGKDGIVQPHIHALFSERTLDGIDRGPALFFKQANAKNPARGGAKKDRFFNNQQAPEQLRYAWADTINYTLQRAGIEARVDPRSLDTRGINRRSTYRTGRKDGAGSTEDPQQWIAETRPIEEQAAKDGWEARKKLLGIENIHTVAPADFLANSRERTRAITAGQAVSTVSREEALRRLEARTAQLRARQERRQRYHRQLQDAQRQHLEARSNPVVLRKLDYLLSYDPAQDEEGAHPHGGTFEWQKERDVSW